MLGRQHCFFSKNPARARTWRKRICRAPKGRELVTPVSLRLEVQEQAFELGEMASPRRAIRVI